MSKIKIRLNEKPFRPGGEVSGCIDLIFDRRVDVRDVLVRFSGSELTGVERRGGSGPRTGYKKAFPILDETKSLLKQIKSSGIGVSHPGGYIIVPASHTLYFTFPLPHDITLSYIGRYVEVEYVVKATFDLPLARDLTDLEKVAISHPDVELPQSNPIKLEGDPKKKKGHLDSDVSLEATMDRAYYKRGETMYGSLCIRSDESMRHIRGIKLLLLGEEHFQSPEGRTSSIKTREYSSRIDLSSIFRGYEKRSLEVPFSFEIPKDAQTTLEGKHFRHEWTFSLAVDVEDARDPVISHPVIIY